MGLSIVLRETNRYMQQCLPYEHSQEISVDKMWSYGEVVAFDLETTGLDIRTALPVSYAFCTYQNRFLALANEQIVNPGVEIPKEAIAIHGISNEEAVERGEDLAVAIRRMYDNILDLGKRNIPLVGMNLTYDLSIVSLLGKQFLGASLYEVGWKGPAVDILVLDRYFVKERMGRRNLAALCGYYGIGNRQPHKSFSDAQASCEILFKMADQFKIDDYEPAMLHHLQGQWYLDWAQNYFISSTSRHREPLTEEQRHWPIYGYAI